MKDNKIIAALVGGLLGVGLLWLTYAPDTVSRAEMVSYVEVTASEHLRFLRTDIRVMAGTLRNVHERVIRMEAILTGRDGRGE